jgi:hypothetical protein
MLACGCLGILIQVCNSIFPNYRRKKNKVVTAHKCPVVTEDGQNDVPKENGGLHHRRVLSKKSVRKEKSSKLSSEQHESSVVESDEISNDTTKSIPHAKRYFVASLYMCVCVTTKSRVFFIYFCDLFGG